ncbi:MAG TPA: NAD(P)H-binding protein [Terriglobia bacterium]|nr:NAD(P)H-binding protein [Terriglobia bacterium]
MNILLFGATGMVGQGVLRECLADPEVQSAQAVGRSATGALHPKLREIVHQDLFHYETLEGQLTGFDACFFCLGISSTGMKEEDYERVTFGITMAAAEVLSRLNRQMTFVYVSGAGTDSSERGRTMWARVKGKTENALLRLPFAAAYMFRPGIIQPLDGIRSKTPVYQVFYTLARPLLPLLRAAFPNQVLTTRQIGQAMLSVARHGFPKRILESGDIRAAAHLSPTRAK